MNNIDLKINLNLLINYKPNKLKQLFDLNTLSVPEIKLLKFINNKKVEKELSVRWIYIEKLKNPIQTLKKLIDLDYLYISNNKFMLSKKGIQTINKNNFLFLSEYEKRPEIYKNISENSYYFLKAHNCLNLYFEQRKNEKYNEFSRYSENDIMWGILNRLILKYQSTKDFFNLSLVYQKMYEILLNEKRYSILIAFLQNTLYCIYLDIINFKNYSSQTFKNRLKKYSLNIYDAMIKCKIDKNQFNEQFYRNVSRYIPEEYSEERIEHLLKIIWILYDEYIKENPNYKNYKIIK